MGAPSELMKWLAKSPKGRETAPMLKLLETIFERGVESVPRKQLKQAFTYQYPPESGVQRLWRHESFPEKLMSEGFRADTRGPLHGRTEMALEALGYTPDDIGALSSQGMPLEVKGAVQQFLSEKYDWPRQIQWRLRDQPGLYYTPDKSKLKWIVPEHNRQQGGVIEALTKPSLKIEDYSHPLQYGWSPDEEIIQTEPNAVLAKFKNLLRILGVGGAAFGGGLSVEGEK